MSTSSSASPRAPTSTTWSPNGRVPSTRKAKPSTTGTSGPARLSTGSSCSRAGSRSTSHSLPSWTSAPDLRASSSPSGSPSKYRLPSRRPSPMWPASAGSASSMPTRPSSAVGRGRLRTGSPACATRRSRSPVSAWVRARITRVGSTGYRQTSRRRSRRRFVRGLEPDELRRALRAARRRLLEEIARTNAELADRLQVALAGG